MRRPILLMVVTALFIASLVALAPSAVAQALQGDAGMLTGADQATQGQTTAADNGSQTPAADQVATAQNAGTTNADPTAQQNAPAQAQAAPPPAYDACGNPIDQTINQCSAAG